MTKRVIRMKVIESLRNKMRGLSKAVNRYPLTMIFLLAMATVNAISINSEKGDYSKYLFTFMVGTLLSAVGQQIYERFFTKRSGRILLMVGAALLTVLFYFTIWSAPEISIENGTKTAVTMFALIIAFIWVPAVKSKVTFNESFMSVFKAGFITLLFTGVIIAGISAILFIIDLLLFSLGSKVTLQAMNFVYSLFAPIYFLSFTPPYPGKKEELEHIKKAVSCPKYLEILISYIIIPLTAVYSLILLVYVLLNIRGEFWTKNLLEPLLVSYAITVILVYILSSHLENPFTLFFRRIFPKVLVPIVVFQTIASILKINDMGITYGRYYVIMFGIFAMIAGVAFSFLPVKKNGIIAPVLILLSAISIIPPIDAFTVSRNNQTHLLESTLTANSMLKNDAIVPNADISVKDKKIITKTVRYLDDMDATKKIAWLPKHIFYYNNFKKTFGFDAVYEETEGKGAVQSQSAYLNWNRSPIVNVKGYDRMIHMNTNSPQTEKENPKQTIPLEIGGNSYTLTKQPDGDFYTIRFKDRTGKELIQFHTEQIYRHVFAKENTEGKEITADQALITQENDRVKMTVLVSSAEVFNAQYNSDFFVFVQIK